jgi:hypothetical protein
LRPGKDYMIGSEFEGAPISLYYTPSPGHYEVISLPQVRLIAPASVTDVDAYN